ncbi:MAG TPA: tetratricopeptide repeat protein, partial [Ferruginibacter sp.]|nr:tetratricopeptide repeat protein [Ferruginibacter sp.]
RAINLRSNARSYFIRGDCRFSQNDFQSALSDYNTAITDYSNYYTTDKYRGRLYYWRGRCKQKLQKWQDAIEDFNSSFTWNYSEPGYAYWNRGNCYYELENYDKSDADYEKAIDKLTDKADLAKLYKYRGDCQGHLKNYDDADKYYSKAISYNADYYGAYWSRGFYRSSNSRRSDAIADYKKAISIIEASGSSKDNASDLASISRNLAILYNADKNYDDALDAINKSLRADPNFVKGFQTRAEIYKNMKNYDKAKADYTNAISLSSNDAAISDMYFDRSYKIDWVMLDYKTAIEDLNQSISLDNKDYMKYWHRAITYDYKKDYPKALADVEKAIDLSTDDPVAGLYRLRASLKEKTGDVKGSIADYQQAAKVDNSDANTYYNLGRLFKTKLKLDDLAETNLNKAIDLAKDDVSGATVAYAKVIKGLNNEAFDYVLTKIDENKTLPYEYKWQLHNAACIYALAGNKTKALEYLDKSLAAGFDDYNHLVNDGDLVSLTALPQYKMILSKYKVPSPKW